MNASSMILVELVNGNLTILCLPVPWKKIICSRYYKKSVLSKSTLCLCPYDVCFPRVLRRLITLSYCVTGVMIVPRICQWIKSRYIMLVLVRAISIRCENEQHIVIERMNPMRMLDRKDSRWTSTMATMMRVKKQRYSNNMAIMLGLDIVSSTVTAVSLASPTSSVISAIVGSYQR